MYGTLISSVTVGSGGASSLAFTSIPQTPYTDLLIVVSSRTTDSGNNAINFNSSASGFSNKTLYGFAGSVGTFSGSTDLGIAVSSGYQANYFGAMLIHIPNYTSSYYKPFSADTVAASYNGGYVFLRGGVWSNTAAITNVTINPPSGTFVEHTTAYLYGITKA